MIATLIVLVLVVVVAYYMSGGSEVKLSPGSSPEIKLETEIQKEIQPVMLSAVKGTKYPDTILELYREPAFKGELKESDALLENQKHSILFASVVDGAIAFKYKSLRARPGTKFLIMTDRPGYKAWTVTITFDYTISELEEFFKTNEQLAKSISMYGPNLPAIKWYIGAA